MLHLIQHHLALLHASSRGNDRIGSSDLLFTKVVASNPQTHQPKFPNQLCDSHPDLIEHTTNVHLIPLLTTNTDTRKQTRSTEIQTNPFPPPSLTHALLPRKHTPHLTPETPLFQSLSRFTGIGFVRTKRNQFFFRRVLTTLIQP